MDSPKRGCVRVLVKSAAGPESAGRFYEEMVKAAGDRKIRGIIIDITEVKLKPDGFLAYGLICGIEEIRDKDLKVALVGKEETALENYFKESMAVNRGISFARFIDADKAAEWVG